jgi:hypothetical protein
MLATTLARTEPTNQPTTNQPTLDCKMRLNTVWQRRDNDKLFARAIS